MRPALDESNTGLAID